MTPAGFARAARRDPGRGAARPIVVGLPLTLRGEHGEQARRDGRVRRGAARRARDSGRDLRRALHLGRSPAATTRARPPTCSRATSNGIAARLSRGPPAARRRCRGARRRRRRVAVAYRRRRTARRIPPLRLPPPPPKPFRIVFPEGFTRAADGRAGEGDVARIADGERHSTVRARASRPTSPRAGPASCRASARSAQQNLEGFLFPATYDFLTDTTSRAARAASSSRRSASSWSERRPRLCALEEPDALRRAEDRLDGRGGGRRAAERPLIAAVIYNRLRDRMQLGIDATLRYGLHIPPTQSITDAELASPNPYNTRKLYGLPPTPIGNPGLASIQAAAHPAQVDYLYYARMPGHRPARVLHRELLALRAVPRDARLRSAPMTTHVALLGHPVSHSLSPRDAERRVRGSSGSTGTTRPSTSRMPLPPSRALRDARASRART